MQKTLSRLIRFYIQLHSIKTQSIILVETLFPVSQKPFGSESVVHISPPEWRLCTARERKLSRHTKAHCVSRTCKLLWKSGVQCGPKTSRVFTLQSVPCLLAHISHRSMQQTNFLLLPRIKFSLVNKTFPPYRRCTTFLS